MQYKGDLPQYIEDLEQSMENTKTILPYEFTNITYDILRLRISPINLLNIKESHSSWIKSISLAKPELHLNDGVNTLKTFK